MFPLSTTLVFKIFLRLREVSCTRPDVRRNYQLSALPDLADTTSRQDDIENRHRVVFYRNYRSTAPGLPSLLVNRTKSGKGAFTLIQLQFLKYRIFNTFSAGNEL